MTTQRSSDATNAFNRQQNRSLALPILLLRCQGLNLLIEGVNPLLELLDMLAEIGLHPRPMFFLVSWFVLRLSYFVPLTTRPCKSEVKPQGWTLPTFFKRLSRALWAVSTLQFVAYSCENGCNLKVLWDGHLARPNLGES